ncbi:2OG-Fe(II) oxygenase, partial [Bacteroidota bacterium]
MNTYYSNEKWIQWLDQLANNDFVIIDQFIPNEILKKISYFFEQQQKLGNLTAAKIGPAENEIKITEIRSDFTYWIDNSKDIELKPFFDFVEELIAQVSQYLFLSLQGFEFHLAKYPKGGFYKPHYDQFKSRNNRVLSLVVYLNDDWQQGDGGELKLHTPKELILEPLMNRAILFRSDTVLHEVLPSFTERKSLTGWLLK